MSEGVPRRSPAARHPDAGKTSIDAGQADIGTPISLTMLPLGGIVVHVRPGIRLPTTTLPGQPPVGTTEGTLS